MMSAQSIVRTLVTQGVIPSEYYDEAVAELHRELSRRSRRIAQTLALMVSMHQFGLHAAELAR